MLNKISAIFILAMISSCNNSEGPKADLAWRSGISERYLYPEKAKSDAQVQISKGNIFLYAVGGYSSLSPNTPGVAGEKALKFRKSFITRTDAIESEEASNLAFEYAERFNGEMVTAKTVR